jgi:L-malate glycosyltransferase
VRRTLETPENALVALTVGHLDLNKNVGSIIDAFHRCHAQRNLWLWIAGNGPTMARLKTQGAAGPAADRIRFLGACNNMPDIYGAADLLVHAAWYDNFPNVYLEAMVSAIPVIGPRGNFPGVISPLEEIIDNGLHGYTYDLLEPNALSDVLLQAAAHPERLEAMGQDARRRALQNYPWAPYIDVVEQAMSGNCPTLGRNGEL